MKSPIFRLNTFEAVIFGHLTSSNYAIEKNERYTLQERIEIIKIHYKNGENFAGTVRKTLTFLGRREAPLVEEFELLGQVSDVKNKTQVYPFLVVL